LIRTRFSFDAVEAGRLIAIPSLFVNLMTPFFGWFSGKINKKGYILICSSMLFVMT
jgi:predicted MFS family arabinose efflux permease